MSSSMPNNSLPNNDLKEGGKNPRWFHIKSNFKNTIILDFYPTIYQIEGRLDVGFRLLETVSKIQKYSFPA